MLYCYGFDLSFNKNSKDKPFAIENGWAVIEAELYEKIVNTATAFRNETSNHLRDGDKLFYTSDTKPVYPKYKLDSYCASNNVTISIVDKLEDSNAVVADIEQSLSPILYSQKAIACLYPVKELKQYLTDDSITTHSVDLENDYVIVTADGIKQYSKYFDQNKVVQKEIYFNFVFSKEETETALVKFEPFTSLFKAITDGKRIVAHKNYATEIHKDSTEMSAELYQSLVGMFASPDADNKTLGVSIVADASRNEKSLPYLVLLYHKFSSNFSKGEQNVQEFNGFINEVIKFDNAEKNIKKVCSDLGMSDTEMSKYLK